VEWQQGHSTSTGGELLGIVEAYRKRRLGSTEAFIVVSRGYLSLCREGDSTLF
jgi:hypothetical protein